MGVINMAHGEMVMIGAYVTFAVQEIIRTHAPHLFDWSLPIALMTAELSSGAAGAGGSISWAEAALGPYYAFSVGTWLNFSVLFDNAIYPVIFLDAAQEVAATFFNLSEFSIFTRFLLGNVFIWTITFINLNTGVVVYKLHKFTIVILCLFITQNDRFS
jgi:urea transport system permease protein